jgi:hypothetical protein
MKNYVNPEFDRWMRPLGFAIVMLMTLGFQSVIAEQLRGFDNNIVWFIFENKVVTNAVTNIRGVKEVPLGTAFGVSVRQAPPLTNLWGYIVTAKHVLVDTNGNHPSEVFLRVNTYDQKIGRLFLPLNAPGNRIYIHPDKSVDIAIIPVNTDDKTQSTFNMKFVTTELIASRQFIETNAITEGESMFFTGLFSPYYGAEHNIPICRFGHLAMLPSERIELAPGQFADLMLMEGESFPGNSGSPVFFQFDSTRVPFVSQVYSLAGVMKGYFKDYSEAEIVSASGQTYLHGNAAVAAVTPALYILDILNCDELKAARAEGEKRLRQGQNPDNR